MDPGFAVTGEDHRVVVGLVRRLDGLPLALELAAARLRTMTLTDLDARLSDRFRVLSGGRRTAVARHRTLRAVVDWSWDLLSGAERDLLQRLSVFAAPVPLDAAAAVAPDLGDELGIADLLGSLTEKSLLHLRPGPPARYALLETIREYGAERLAGSGGLDAVLAARTGWALRLVEGAARGLRGPGQLTWSHRLDAAADDLLATLRHLVAEGRGEDAVRFAVPVVLWWSALGRHAQVAEWVRLARSVPAPGAPGQACVLEVVDRAMGMVEELASPAETSARLAELRGTLRALPPTGRSPLTEAVSMFLERFAGFEQDPFAEQGETPEQAAAIEAFTAELGDDPWGVALVHVVRAAAAENAGDRDLMVLAAERAVGGFRAAGDSWGLAGSLRLLAQARVYAGELEEAEALYLEAGALTARFGAAEDDELLLRLRLLEVRQRLGRTGEAAAELERLEAVAAGGSAPNRTWLALAQVNAALRRGRVQDALALAQRHARSLDERPGAAGGHERAALLAVLVHAHLAAGEVEEAGALLPQALGAGVATRDMPILAGVVVAAARWAVLGGDAARGARWIGVAAQLRGADEDSDPHVREVVDLAVAGIGAAAVAQARARGRGLDRAAAVGELAGTFPLSPALAGAGAQTRRP